MQLGPGAGYAYHLVLPLNLFVMGSLIGSINMDYVTEANANGQTSRFNLMPGLFYRVAAGYSNGRWNFNASVFNAELATTGSAPISRYIVNTGNYRITLARRFVPGKKTKSLLKPIHSLNLSR